ncbi:asparaginase [Canibacter sp. lx-45]|uniref:asparaginase n=1 Tax=Canibacter zhuwentaonis TaxID=2837491 RepID=UPI001BDCC54F|nr:asparaginase [Canibacter zhuwentaonis]MBT1035295.1 asparaginase [Canibacter zhuwentaonis]
MSRTEGTCAVSEATQLAVTTRGGFIESRHSGSAIVLSAAGDTLISLGNPGATVLTRSALKPLQVLAMHGAGLELANRRQLAISFASHTGTAEHVEVVREILHDSQLTESHLLCPAALPLDSEARIRAIKHDESASPIQMGCSGKHAAMLATCVAAGWDTADYTHQDHPLQQHILQTVQRLSAENVSCVTVDGCGAPVLGMSLTALARGYRRIANADPNSPFPINRTMALMFEAGRAYPHLIEGSGAQDTIVMQNSAVFAKYGAEGISAMAADDGTIAIVKVLDGSPRASRAVALSLLTYVGSVSKHEFMRTLKALPLAITGGLDRVGEIQVDIPTLQG